MAAARQWFRSLFARGSQAGNTLPQVARAKDYYIDVEETETDENLKSVLDDMRSNAEKNTTIDFKPAEDISTIVSDHESPEAIRETANKLYASG